MIPSPPLSKSGRVRGGYDEHFEMVSDLVVYLVHLAGMLETDSLN